MAFALGFSEVTLPWYEHRYATIVHIEILKLYLLYGIGTTIVLHRTIGTTTVLHRTIGTTIVFRYVLW